MWGIAGCHRTGKSTLAKEFCKKHEMTYLETSVSSVFKSMNLDPSVTYDFKTRMEVQWAILKHLDAVYSSVEDDNNTVTDRTPLDLLIYTFAEVNADNLSEEETEDLLLYKDACIEMINRRFNMILIVQPGIPVIADVMKGSTNVAYMEHINTLALGFSCDEKMECGIVKLSRSATDLNYRIRCLELAIDSKLEQTEKLLSDKNIH